MKKLFRHITKAIIFSFVVCLFLPLQSHAAMIDSREIARSSADHWYDYDGPNSERYIKYSAINYPDNVDLCMLSCPKSPSSDYTEYYLVASDTTYGIDAYQETFLRGDSGSGFSVIEHRNLYPYDYSKDGKKYHYTFCFELEPHSLGLPYSFKIPKLDFESKNSMMDFITKGDISEDIPPDVDTDMYSLDKSLGMVKNAKWKHLESKDEYNKVLQNAMNSGTGTGDSGNANYSDIYTHYASFVQDKCSFATTSTSGVKIGGRYQLQYASRVGFTFAYNLPDLLEGIDNTKQYYKKFGSSKPYPIVNGTNFDANQNIQSLFVQAYQWNDTLPSIGTWKRSLVFKETKYWIDVRIIDTKNKTYGAWYAMDMKTNTAKEVVTGDGDIDSDISSEDNAHDYTKEEGEGDTFKDAEDNAKEVDKSTHYDQKWYDSIKGNTKKSAPAFKNLLSMITGIPSMISTLFSWLPSWVLELVSAFFALVVVLALLRFVLGS